MRHPVKKRKEINKFVYIVTCRARSYTHTAAATTLRSVIYEIRAGGKRYTQHHLCRLTNFPELFESWEKRRAKTPPQKNGWVEVIVTLVFGLSVSFKRQHTHEKKKKSNKRRPRAIVFGRDPLSRAKMSPSCLVICNVPWEYVTGNKHWDNYM